MRRQEQQGGQVGDSSQVSKCGRHQRGVWRAQWDSKAVDRYLGGGQRTAQQRKQFSEVYQGSARCSDWEAGTAIEA